jgi:hypothetical protein
MAWIVEPWAFIRQLVLVTERVNSLKSKLFGAVVCLKTGVAEFSHPLDQSGQARCHLRLSSLVVNEQRKQMSVCPLRGNVHINQQSPSINQQPPSEGSSL